MPADDPARDPADDIPALYERHAFAWAQDRGTRLHLEARWMDRFEALLPPRATLLDIGCGSGMPIAGHFIARGHRLTGIDTSARLIALCRQRFPRHRWALADMRQLALGWRFDGLLAWHSFFHLAPDAQRAMFPRFQAHAAPGAALMFTSGSAEGESIGSYRGEALHHASLSPAAYRRLLEQHGFELVDHQAEDPDCGGATVWLARMTKAP
jgi:SAM-dependent methyltransferase